MINTRMKVDNDASPFIWVTWGWGSGLTHMFAGGYEEQDWFCLQEMVAS